MVAENIHAIYATEEERLTELKACRNDLYYLGKYVLGYSDAEPAPHRELCNFVQSASKRKFLLGCRGIYKTSFGTIARTIQLILRDPNVRILIVQNTAQNASKTITEIKNHFETNERLRQLVPDLVPSRRHDTRWSNHELQVNRTRIFREPTVMGVGVDSSLTSLHFDYILGDDVVSAERDDMTEGSVIALRAEEVDKAIGWFAMTLRGLMINRKDHQTEVQFIVNRWGPYDFARFIMDRHIRSDENPTGFTFNMGAVDAIWLDNDAYTEITIACRKTGFWHVIEKWIKKYYTK